MQNKIKNLRIFSKIFLFLENFVFCFKNIHNYEKCRVLCKIGHYILISMEKYGINYIRRIFHNLAILI
jgi:hypothetical protein